MNEMMPETGRFATTGALDEAFLRKHARYMGIGRYALILAIAYFVIGMVSLALYWWSGFAVQIVLALVCFVLMILMPWRRYKRWLKLCVKRMKEISPEGQEMINVSCMDHGVRVENQTTGAAVTLGYENVVKAVETDDTVLLVTKARQMTAFFKSSLTEQECGELMDYLRGKGVRVKAL